MKLSEVEPNMFPKTFINKSAEIETSLLGERPKPVRIHVIKNHKPANTVPRATPTVIPRPKTTMPPTNPTTTATLRSTSIKRQKIDHFCLKKDVQSWTLNDVFKWVMKTCAEYDLPKPYPVDRFIMNGKALLLLTKQDFVNRSRFCGDVLYHAFVNFTSATEFKEKPAQSDALVPKTPKPLVKSPSITKTDLLSYTNYYQMFNDTTSSIYNVDGIIQDMDRCDNTNDGLYDYLKYLNDISLSGVSNKQSTPASPTSYSSSTAPSPPPPYQSIKYSASVFSTSPSPSPSTSTSTSTPATSNDKSKINFNYTNNQVHYHIYDMNYFNDLTPANASYCASRRM